MVAVRMSHGEAGGVAEGDGGWSDLTLYVKGFESWMPEHSKDVAILLDELPGSGRQRISRTPPRPPSLRDCILFPKRRLGISSGFHKQRARSPVARKTRAISRGFTRFPQLNQGTLQESFSFSLTPVKAMHLH
jgi:hypothetical protein